jgi:hypothetical protein
MDFGYDNNFYGGEDDDVKLEHYGGEDEEVESHGGYYGGYNEFMVGGDDEEENKPVMGGSCCDGGNEISNQSEEVVSGGYDGGAFFASCGVAFLVVIAVLILFKWMTSKTKRVKTYRKRIPVSRALPAPVRHIDVFDNVMTPSSYFDYDQHGMQYINWTANQ